MMMARVPSISGHPTQSGTSNGFIVHPGPFQRMQIVMPGQSPLPGSLSGVTGVPASQAAGRSFTVNVYATKAKGSDEEPLINVLVGKGAHFAVCQMATHAFSGMIAKATGSKSEAIYKELSSNLIGNARLVPAGIVAVNRAQEYGYSYVFTG